MTTRPDRLSAARDRVRGFLDTRAKMGGPIDREVIHSLGRGDDTFELRVDDLEHLLAVTSAPAYAPVGTRSPSVRLPHDTALRILRDAVDQAVASGARPAELFRSVIHGLRGLDLGGKREQLEAYLFEALVTEHPSPLRGMIGSRGDRDDYAVLSITRDESNAITVDVVP